MKEFLIIIPEKQLLNFWIWIEQRNTRAESVWPK